MTDSTDLDVFRERAVCRLHAYQQEPTLSNLMLWIAAMTRLRRELRDADK